MKTKPLSILLLTLSCFSLIITSCKKEVAQANDVAVATSADDALSDRTGKVTVVTLVPGPNDGQDTYVSKIDNDPNDGNANMNFTHEILASKFYYYDQLSTQRAYIKFDSLLSKVPSTARILGAKLYLYGESTSLSFPYGNSYYPGSGNPDNSCYLQRVIGGDWDQSTLTWNTMPAITAKGQVVVPASTSQWNYNTEVDVTSLVVPIVKSGKNYGFCMLQQTEEPYRILEFSTSESSDPNLRPKLVVAYR